MEHDEIFDKICKPEFEELKAADREILDLLKGTNGKPGYGERIRNLEKSKKAVWGAVVFVIAAGVIELVSFIAERLKGG